MFDFISICFHADHGTRCSMGHTLWVSADELVRWRPVADLPLPVEYASIDIPGDCGIQAYEFDVQQLLVEYYSAASRRYSTSEKAKISNDSHASNVVNHVLGDFKADMC